jgi:hypothetical protein
MFKLLLIACIDLSAIHGVTSALDFYVPHTIKKRSTAETGLMSNEDAMSWCAIFH